MKQITLFRCHFSSQNFPLFVVVYNLDKPPQFSYQSSLNELSLTLTINSHPLSELPVCGWAQNAWSFSFSESVYFNVLCVLSQAVLSCHSDAMSYFMSGFTMQ